MCDLKIMCFLLIKSKIYDKQSKRGSYKHAFLTARFSLRQNKFPSRYCFHCPDN